MAPIAAVACSLVLLGGTISWVVLPAQGRTGQPSWRSSHGTADGISSSVDAAADSLWASTKGSQAQRLLDRYARRVSRVDLDVQGLLRAAPDATQLRQALQLFQTSACEATAGRFELLTGPGVIASKVGNLTVHIYDNKDIVSEHVKKGSWESDETSAAVWAINAPLPAAASDSKRQEAIAKAAAQPVFIDIGANIGWFALHAANAAARVLAFEAMPANQALLRASICATPSIMDRVTLYPMGLGPKNDTCWIVSHDSNVGDGHSICGNLTSEQAASKLGPVAGGEYRARSQMTVRRLDDLLADWTEDIKVLKMDVEGFELSVLEGAAGFLATHNVWYIIMEANGGLIGKEGVVQQVRYLHNLGYTLSGSGFSGPWIPDVNITSGQLPELWNLYGIKQRNVV